MHDNQIQPPDVNLQQVKTNLTVCKPDLSAEECTKLRQQQQSLNKADDDHGKDGMHAQAEGRADGNGAVIDKPKAAADADDSKNDQEEIKAPLPVDAVNPHAAQEKHANAGGEDNDAKVIKDEAGGDDAGVAAANGDQDADSHRADIKHAADADAAAGGDDGANGANGAVGAVKHEEADDDNAGNNGGINLEAKKENAHPPVKDAGKDARAAESKNKEESPGRQEADAPNQKERAAVGDGDGNKDEADTPRDNADAGDNNGRPKMPQRTLHTLSVAMLKHPEATVATQLSAKHRNQTSKRVAGAEQQGNNGGVEDFLGVDAEDVGAGKKQQLPQKDPPAVAVLDAPLKENVLHSDQSQGGDKADGQHEAEPLKRNARESSHADSNGRRENSDHGDRAPRRHKDKTKKSHSDDSAVEVKERQRRNSDSKKTFAKSENTKHRQHEDESNVEDSKGNRELKSVRENPGNKADSNHGEDTERAVTTKHIHGPTTTQVRDRHNDRSEEKQGKDDTKEDQRKKEAAAAAMHNIPLHGLNLQQKSSARTRRERRGSQSLWS